MILHSGNSPKMHNRLLIIQLEIDYKATLVRRLRELT